MIFEFIIIFVLLFIIVGLVYQFMYDLYMWSLIVSTTFYICYIAVKLVFYFRNKKKRESQKVPMQTIVSVKQEENATPKAEKKEDKEEETLKIFIKKNLKQGFQASVLKEALTKQGWPKEKIEQAFKESK